MLNPSSIWFTVFLIAAMASHALKEVEAITANDQTAIISTEAEAQITSAISNGTPSPLKSKPTPLEFKVERSMTKRVHVVESPEMPGLPAPEGTINVTLQLVKDPGLPDPPPPVPSLPPDDPTVSANPGELTEQYWASQLLFLSATVYDHSRTYFRCAASGVGNRKEICGWSNLDFNHFSDFASYQLKGADGEVRGYDLLMGIGNENTRSAAGSSMETDGTTETPVIPKLPGLATSGPTFVITEGDTTDRETMELVEGLHSLYHAEGARMETAYHARIKAYEERKAYLLANPPKPKDVTIQFWKRTQPSPRGVQALGGEAQP